MILRIKILEPLHIGAKQISGFEDIGGDRAIAIPMPSTALGALATALGVTRGEDAFEALGCGRVWGPLIEIEGAKYFLSEGRLYAVSDVKRYLEAVKNPRVEPPRPRYIVETLTRPGVRLENKLARNLYHVVYTWIRGENGKPLAPGSISVLYYIECNVNGVRELVRVGGEGRVAVVEAVGSGEGPAKCLEGVLLSPLLFYSQGPYAEVGVAKGLEDVEEIYGVLTETWPPKVKSTYVGLGFSIGLKRRRAVYQALPPGTALKLKREAVATGLHSERGYGSVLC